MSFAKQILKALLDVSDHYFFKFTKFLPVLFSDHISRSDNMLNAISSLLEPVNVAFHSLNI